MLLVVETEVLTDRDLKESELEQRVVQRLSASNRSTHVIYAARAVGRRRLTVTNKAVRPHPLDVLHGASGLREHDVAQAGIVRSGRCIGDGEVLARVVTVEEDGDIVYLGRVVVGVWWQLQSTIR